MDNLRRLKNYNFSANVHLAEIRGTNLLLDVNSGAIHVIDEAAACFIKGLRDNAGDWEAARSACLIQFTPEIVTEAEQELQEAIDNGALFTAEDDLSSFNYESAVPKALCLNVAHACNMRCKYCFAGQGTFGEEAMLMSSETAYKAVDFLISASQGRRNLEIDFFGGEPLLNFEVVKATVEYARQRAAATGKEIALTLTTNSLDLDESASRYLIEEGIAIIVSLDGRPEVNDCMRPATDGSGTYERVLANIRRIIDMDPVSYYVRGTFTAHNLDFAEDFRHLTDLGFTNISLEPVVGGENGIVIQEQHLLHIMKEYENMADHLLALRDHGRPITFFHFNLDMNRGPCLSKRLTGCGAGVEYLAVTPAGKLYPCHQFIGQQEFCIGDVFEGIQKPEIVTRFARNTLLDKDCRRCWARFFCGGGCHASAFYANRDISMPNAIACQMHKKRIECAFYLAAKTGGGSD
ncbi:MAG: thioether cross-link-forming SCIFF peptide maturase [Candidatus Saccharibacteria bacterium]